MPSPFATIDYAKALGVVKAPDDFAEAHAMAYADEPDHWKCGKAAGEGFLGPTGLDTRGLTEQQARAVGSFDADVRGSLARAFVPVDRLSEVSGRRVDGPLASEVRLVWEVSRTLAPAVAEVKDDTGLVVSEARDAEAPTPDEAERIAELDAVTEWAFGRATRFQSLLRRWMRGVNAFGEMYARPFTPPARVREDGTVADVGDLGAALQAIFVEPVTPDRAKVREDETTKTEAGVVTFAGGTDILGATVPAAVEVSYVDTEAPAIEGQAVTMLRVIEQGKAEAAPTALPLRGRPLLVRMRDDDGAFIDKSARKLQKAINTASTERRIVNDEDGFRIKMLLGARPPGRWVTEGEGADAVTRFEPEEWALRPGTILNVTGEEAYHPTERAADGSPVVTGTTRPDAKTFEAADPKQYAEEVADRTLELRERCKQGWVHTTGEAGVSGISREVAMSDYLTDARTAAGMVSEAAEALLELVADYAAHLAGQPGRYYGIRARVECKVSKPPLRPEERDASLKLNAAGIWSTDRTMQYNDVEDTAAEREEIAAERKARSADDNAGFLGAFAALAPAGGDGQAGAAPVTADDISNTL